MCVRARARDGVSLCVCACAHESQRSAPGVAPHPACFLLVCFWDTFSQVWADLANMTDQRAPGILLSPPPQRKDSKLLHRHWASNSGPHMSSKIFADCGISPVQNYSQLPGRASRGAPNKVPLAYKSPFPEVMRWNPSGESKMENKTQKNASIKYHRPEGPAASVFLWIQPLTIWNSSPSAALCFCLLSSSSFSKHAVASSLYICKCCWLWIESMFTFYSKPHRKACLNHPQMPPSVLLSLAQNFRGK